MLISQNFRGAGRMKQYVMLCKTAYSVGKDAVGGAKELHCGVGVPEKEAGTGLRRPARCWRSTAPVCQASVLGEKRVKEPTFPLI